MSLFVIFFGAASINRLTTIYASDGRGGGGGGSKVMVGELCYSWPK